MQRDKNLLHIMFIAHKQQIDANNHLLLSGLKDSKVSRLLFLQESVGMSRKCVVLWMTLHGWHESVLSKKICEVF